MHDGGYVNEAWSRVREDLNMDLSEYMSEDEYDFEEPEDYEEYYVDHEVKCAAGVRKFWENFSTVLHESHGGVTFEDFRCGVCEFDGSGQHPEFKTLQQLLQHCKDKKLGGRCTLHREYVRQLERIMADRGAATGVIRRHYT